MEKKQKGTEAATGKQDYQQSLSAQNFSFPTL